MFAWYWLADLCAQHQIPFILGHALYMKAIHGGKTKTDKIDSQKIALLLRGGMLPQAYVYPSAMRATRDLLRRRTRLVRTRAEALAHVQNTINRSGGEKRLNVAFSRAKHHMAVVSSIRHTDITNDYNYGAASLKNYLRYAEAVSAGEWDSARRVLRGMSRWREATAGGTEDHDAVAQQIAAELSQRGWQVDHAVGQSHFRCDLAIRRPGDAAYRLAVLVDSAAYYEQSDILERDMMRPKLLQEFGWKIAFVLAKDWYLDRERVLDGLLARLDEPDVKD